MPHTLAPHPLVARCMAFFQTCVQQRQQPTLTAADLLPVVQAWIAHMQAIHQAMVETPDLPPEVGVEAWEWVSESLTVAWSRIQHLQALFNPADWQLPFQEALMALDQAVTQAQQDPAWYNRIRSWNIPASTPHQAVYQRRIQKWCQDCEEQGVHLVPKPKKRFQDLSQQLVQLQHQFETQVTEARDSWTYAVGVDEAPIRCAGLPAHTLEHARRRAEAAGQTGYLFDLAQPTYSAVMRYANDRSLRQIFYQAYQTLASPTFPGPCTHDNTSLAYAILQCRQEMASILGFSQMTEWLLARRMIRDPEAVLAFLHTLQTRITPVAQAEWAAIEQAFHTYAPGSDSGCAMWDYAWTAERMQKDQFGIDSESVRPYFPYSKVLSGLWDCLHTIFGLDSRPCPPESLPFPLWDPQVQAYLLTDSDRGDPVGIVLMDNFARPGKRSGAWMDTCQNHLAISGVSQLPIAFLTCNFTPPAPGAEAYLIHEEILTLFHEMGHCLHHLATTVPLPTLAGINGVEWDAVELPSQFLECFAWEPARLQAMSAHQDTGAPLPEAWIAQICQQRTFQAALHLLRQVDLSRFDMVLHHQFDPQQPAAQIRAIRERINRETGIFPIPDYVRFENQFSHIFAGGYAAGYYSYLWSEVLSTHAYETWNGLSPAEQRNMGMHFRRMILARGSVESASTLFQDFKGTPPDPEALLRYYGLDNPHTPPQSA